jgi:uncharacterized protein
MSDHGGPSTRHQSLDALRGIAVMAILLMNIISFALPEEAYGNPRAAGGMSLADLWTWAVMFVVVDGKMRGLFSLLFGASMLLVINRAEAKGEDPVLVHCKRMLWLLLIGTVHCYFIWAGDILMLYAICGLFAVVFVAEDCRSLIKWSLSLFLANWLLWGISTLLSLSEMRSTPDMTAMVREVAAYSNTYADTFFYRFGAEQITRPFLIFISNALETIGLFTCGMSMLKSGFLTGTWAKRDYWRIAKIAYVIGVVPLSILAAYAWSHGFDTRVVRVIDFAIAPPFRIAVTLGHAAILTLLVKHVSHTAAMARLAAAGRAAFSNYLGTSLAMTTLFYGYGFGLFNQPARWQAYLIVPLVWAIILLWSKPWLDRFHYGPAEWLWRSLARGERQPFVKR